MAFVFDNLSQQHLERLQRDREALERELALRCRRNSEPSASLNDAVCNLAREDILRCKMDQ